MLRPVANPPPRFQSAGVEWDDEPDLAKLRIYEDDSRSVLAHNDSPDLRHRWSLNPYRGCTHACAYCYARASHEYLGFGAGTDHDTRIVVKVNAAALLDEALMHPKWVGESIVFSGNTDCYQSLEHRYRLTRSCLEVCLAFRQSVAIITKSFLIERDLDVLVQLHQRARLEVVISVPFADATMGRLIEPGAPSPARRFQTIRTLSDAGLSVSVNIAPVIPGLNDYDIPRVLTKAREAGARRASLLLVRLVGPVADVFEARLRDVLPQRADVVLGKIRRARNGELGSSVFGDRMRGQGVEWEASEAVFNVWKRRLGYEEHSHAPDPPSNFQRPSRPGQQVRLF